MFSVVEYHFEQPIGATRKRDRRLARSVIWEEWMAVSVTDPFHVPVGGSDAIAFVGLVRSKCAASSDLYS